MNKFFKNLINLILLVTCLLTLSGCNSEKKSEKIEIYKASNKSISFVEEIHATKDKKINSYRYLINGIETCFIFPFKPETNNLHPKYLSYQFNNTYDGKELLAKNINPTINTQNNPATLSETYEKIIMPSPNKELHLFYRFMINYKNLRTVTIFYYDTVTKESHTYNKINPDQYNFKTVLRGGELTFKLTDNKDTLYFGDLVINNPSNLDNDKLKSNFLDKELYGSLYFDLELFCFQNTDYKFLLNSDSKLIKTYIDNLDGIITIVKESFYKNKVYKISTATFKVFY